MFVYLFANQEEDHFLGDSNIFALVLIHFRSQTKNSDPPFQLLYFSLFKICF